MHILLVGIQGSGKGTQARRIISEYSTDFFEMGVKLRSFGEMDHPRSAEVKSTLAAGNLITDDIVLNMLQHYRNGHDGKTIVFDGIPRTPTQKATFDAVFPEYIVIFLDLARDEAIRRIAGRRIDPTTGESFPSDFVGDFSPFTGQRLVRRADDTPEAAMKRIDTFYQNTLPLIAMWAEDKKRVYRIDASKSVEDVWEHIQVVLSAYFPR